MRLANKTVVVTGACGLLGQQFSESIIQNGGNVVLADINLSKSEQIMNKFELLYPGKSSFHKLDINKKNEIENLIDTYDKKNEKIDAIVNNAYPKNKNFGKKLQDVHITDFNENINLHLGGYFLTSQIFSEYFITFFSMNLTLSHLFESFIL